MTKPILPKTFPGATKASFVVVALIAVFLAGLCVLAIFDHMDRKTISMTAVGTVMFAVMAAVQFRQLRAPK